MEFKNLVIKTKDKKVEHKIYRAHIFTAKYFKKLKKNEIHSSKAAKLIIWDRSNIYNYLLINAIVKVDSKGNILVLTNQTFDVMIGKEEVFDKDKTNYYKNINKAYESKKAIGMSIEEIIEWNRAKTVVELIKLNKKKIKEEIGGGF